MATDSSILAWRIPWRSLAGYSPWCCQYLAVLPDSLMRSTFFFLWHCEDFLCIVSSANSDSGASSFPICIPFISFSCLIAVARTSNTILNKSG